MVTTSHKPIKGIKPKDKDWILLWRYRNNSGMIHTSFACVDQGFVSWVKKPSNAHKNTLSAIRSLAQRFQGGELEIVHNDEI